MMVLEILPYPKLPVAFHEYDPRCDAAAQRVIHLITSRLPGVVVEHIGSTAVPNCGAASSI